MDLAQLFGHLLLPAELQPGLAARIDGFFDVSAAGRFAPHVAPTSQATNLAGVDGVIVRDDQAASLLAAARFAAAETDPGEPIFVYPSSPMLYVMTNRPNPTRFAHLYPGAASADELRQITTTLDQIPVRVVVVSTAALSFWGPAAANEPLESYLAHTYRDIARFGEYRVLIRS